MAERVLLRKSCFSFCSDLAVSRQDGVFYEIMFSGFGAVCRLGDVTGVASVYTKTYMDERMFWGGLPIRGCYGVGQRFYGNVYG